MDHEELIVGGGMLLLGILIGVGAAAGKPAKQKVVKVYDTVKAKEHYDNGFNDGMRVANEQHKDDKTIIEMQAELIKKLYKEKKETT